MGHPHAKPFVVDVLEHGAIRNGQPQSLDRRLFMQLLVFECGSEHPAERVTEDLLEAVSVGRVTSVLYADLLNPAGFALLAWSESPDTFVTGLRPAFHAASRKHAIVVRSPLCMQGRTYSTGFEDDLEYWLIRRPQETVTHGDWPWAIWYPLRRGGMFEKLEPHEKGQILREHATIGRAYGEADLAHDVRLACHGMDTNDNEFLLGLVGKELHPLSHVVQSMRGTRQTAEFITQMGPFFVGRRLWVHTPESR